MKENGNGQASFDFSLLTAFRVVENASQRYFEEGFGGETPEEKLKKHRRKKQETTQETTRETTRERILAAIQAKPEIKRSWLNLSVLLLMALNIILRV